MISPDLAALLAKPNAAELMLDRYARVHNGNGSRDMRTQRRLNSTVIRLDGVDLQVQYDTHGTYMGATEIDPEEYPVAIVKLVACGGWDVTRLLASREEEIAAAIERQWGEE